MNIVQVSSGLGNQLFQYALYRSLCERGYETKLDTSIYRYRPSHQGYELAHIFDLQPHYATIAERDKMADVSKSIWAQIRRNWLHYTHPTQGQIVREADLHYTFHERILSNDNQYLIGWWQTEKYFAAISPLLRNELRFIRPLSSANQSIANDITQCVSVSIHVRRGDYLKKRNKDKGSVCTPAYYEQSIAFILSQIPNAHFFVFSDEIEWVKANMTIPHATYIHGNVGKEAYVDMQLMSLCQHHIIANSSFSWWGAWLNPHPNKIVVAPSIWFRGRPRPDVLPAEWITMPIQ